MKQAEKYDLEKLQVKCIHLVSEYPVNVMKFDDLSVSLENQVKIYRLASQRNELILSDHNNDKQQELFGRFGVLVIQNIS